jgi:long-chain acyl-CoA synthetase
MSPVSSLRATAEAIWLPAYPAGVPARIDPDAFASVHAMLLDACQHHRDRPAFDCLGATMTYGDWESASRYFAAFLLKTLGRRQGDRVAIMLPNLLSYPVAFLGTLRAGLTVVNVNPLYTQRELEYQLKDSGATTIVIMENFAHKLEAVLGATRIEHVVVARLGDLTRPPKRWIFNFVNSYIRRAVPQWKFPRFTWFQETIRSSARGAFEDARTAPTHVALLQYTGGTTGVPKAAVLSHRNLVANALQCRIWIGTRLQAGSERVLTPLPLYHIFSLTANLLIFASLGGLNVLVPDPRDLRRLIATMRRTRVTAMTGVNTLFNALLNTPEFCKLDFSALKVAIGGGAAIQTAVATRWQATTGTPLIEGYGLSEASPVVCINPPDGRERAGSVGLPVPSTELSIRDDEGHSVPVGEGGEIWVRGPQVMQSYWMRPDETRKVLTEDGWLQTGDVGMLDREGFVRILDRKKDIIIVSGFNVFPNEVEEVVVLHPGVLEAAVIGVPDERTGEAVKLFVVKRDADLTEDAVRRHCRDSLAGYKLPKVIEFRNELPKSNVGKILRKELR